MADAGRAMMLYRGLYDSTYPYEKLDVVNHNGSLYISTTDGNLGTEPTDVTKWKLFLQGGVSDNIQATDTYGLVGEAGGSSFVQLLLDSIVLKMNDLVSGVKGNKESKYRNGNVNITAENVGALPITGSGYGNGVFGSNDIRKWGECSASTMGGTENTVGDGWGTLLKFGSMRPVYFFYAWNIGKCYIKMNDADFARIAFTEDVLNSLEEIEANTSEANIAGALALKKAIVKSTYVEAGAIPNEELDSDNAIGKFRFVVPISVDYSGINGKILSTSLIHIGTDSTAANGGLSKSLLLAGMGGDGNEKIIKNILVYSKDYQTVRVKILVEYVEN